MSRDPLRDVQRDLYLASRTLGDINAAQRGPGALLARLVRRSYHRKLIRLLRRVGLW